MIAVLDLTAGGDWRFIRDLHHLGFAVSWVVRRSMAMGIETFPIGFRGCLHRVGLDDGSQLQTSIAGCKSVMILTDDSTSAHEVTHLVKFVLNHSAPDVGCFRVRSHGHGYEIESMDTKDPASSGNRSMNLTNLVSRVG